MGEYLGGGEGGRGEISLQEKSPEYLASSKREPFLPIKGKEEERLVNGEGGTDKGDQGNYLWQLPILPLLERSCSDCGRRWDSNRLQYSRNFCNVWFAICTILRNFVSFCVSLCVAESQKAKTFRIARFLSQKLIG